MDDQETQKLKSYSLSPLWRIGMFLAIIISLILDKPWINFIVGGLGGVLLYPVVENFLKDLIED
jgi:hypothetical protein